jgi:FSR family fosmidomycin resistance protein-like MFS transporter
MNQTAAIKEPSPETTTFTILFAVSFCHLLNDMMQAMLPAIYPNLKEAFHLTFTQVGLVTLIFQCTASLLQPLVGLYSDRRPMPRSLAAGMISTLIGLLILSVAWNYAIVLLAAAFVGVGSSTFHPESSRVARMASGGRHGLAQSLFQVGGNIGSALGPLTAAAIVASYGQHSVALYSLLALTAIIILWNVGTWYKHHGLKRMHHARAVVATGLSQSRVVASVVILLLLIFSKYFYLASITSYYTFYLIHKFHVSVQVSQIHLFLFLAAVAAGTIAGGPLGDRFGRKIVIWFSILGPLPFTLMLPDANLFWTSVLSVIIGVILASAFSTIGVYGQELMPGKVGMVSGMFYGFSFGMGGLGAAVLGYIADQTSIDFVYRICSFLPLLGLLTVFLPDMRAAKAHA